MFVIGNLTIEETVLFFRDRLTVTVTQWTGGSISQFGVILGWNTIWIFSRESRVTVSTVCPMNPHNVKNVTPKCVASFHISSEKEACGDNESTSDTNHVATSRRGPEVHSHSGEKWLHLCAWPYLLHLWPALTPQTHLQKHPIVCPQQHRDRGSEEEVLVIKGIVMVQWTFIGPLKVCNSSSTLVWAEISWYQLLLFIVAISTIQMLAIGADLIWLSENKRSTPLHMYFTLKPKGLSSSFLFYVCLILINKNHWYGVFPRFHRPTWSPGVDLLSGTGDRSSPGLVDLRRETWGLVLFNQYVNSLQCQSNKCSIYRTLT